jgi:hypothetical protein
MSTDHGPVILLSIEDIAKYLKNLIPVNMPETYDLKNRIKSISEETEIRSGVIAYRDFLLLFYDRIISEGHLHIQPRKKPKKDTDYPLLYSITDLLADIGYYGELAERGDALLITRLPSFTASVDEKGRKKSPRNSSVKLTEALRFLSLCGFDFGGIDLNAKRMNLSEGTLIEVTYPKSPVLLTGLKAMAIADIELRVKRYKSDFNHDNLLLCDYRLLKENETETTDVLSDCLVALPENVRATALDLHRYFTDKGMDCEPIRSTFESHFAYAYIKNSRKALSAKDKYERRLWEFAISTKHGYNLVVRAKKTDKYPELVERLPALLQDKIEAGYGCDRKLYGEPCQRGCQGMRFPLDESIVEVADSIKTWIDKELSYKY